jgi:hypothetical protein
MAITTYTELKTAIANWTGRADFSSRDEEFISLAEARIYQQAAKRGGLIGMEKLGTVTLSASTETATVPSDFIRAISFRLDNESPLDQKTLSQMASMSNVEDKPRFYATAGGTSPLFYIRPIPDGAYSASLVYVAKFPTLSGSNASNWLLENAPNAYLYGACIEAAGYVRDASMAEAAHSLFNEALDGLLGLTRQYRFSEPPIRSLDASLTGRAFERAF